MIRAFSRSLLEALLPASCAACDAPSGGAPLCALCQQTLEFPEPREDAHSAYAYGGALAQAIRRAKFQGDESRGRGIAQIWRDALTEESGFFVELLRAEPLDGVTFVPLHWRRRLQRGFDLSSLLAYSAAEVAALPVVDALACRRLDPPLSRAPDGATRAARVRGRYGLRRIRASRGDVRDKHLLLVDDVVTTGATLAEASQVLRGGGARVTAVSLAATPAG